MVLPRALLRWLALTRTVAALTTTVPIPVDTRAPVRGGTRLYGVFDDVVATAEGLLSKFLPSPAPYNASQVRPGNVMRAAVKAQNLSRATGWTTTKPSVPGFGLGVDGCAGDYNNYRATQLKNTRDRAISIITSDVYGALRQEGWPVDQGDLGENLFVDGMAYGTFAVGRRFQLGATALVEITEAIVPCGYLCTLPYLSQKWRCADFIRTLAGRRGWYAKVRVPGYVAVGDPVVALPS